jgi:hypothetical protein
MLNIFLDPAASAVYVPLAWSWLWPLLLTGIVIAVTSWLNLPVVERIMRYNPPGRMTAEQLERAMPMILSVQKVMVFVLPLFVALFTGLAAGLLQAACAVLDIRSTFRNNFALLSIGALFGALQQIASYFVIRLKGDSLQSLAELRPGFGLDLLLSDEAPGALRGLLAYFSIFNIWYIAMLTLTFVLLARITKGKAFAAMTPVWILGMILSVVGSLFSR